MSAFKTITTRYATRCRRCGADIGEGETVRWLAKRGVWHLAADCVGTGEAWYGPEPDANSTFVRDPGEDMSDRFNEYVGADNGGPF